MRGIVMASEWVGHKVLKIMRGFLVYVALAYRPLTPFLMGLYICKDGWRSGRDEEGWRLSEAEVKRVEILKIKVNRMNLQLEGTFSHQG
jgi:hypothetical protein